MNKVLYYIRNILFLLVITFFIITTFSLDAICNILSLIVYPLFAIILILHIRQHLKKKDNIKYNSLYNISFIIAMIYVTIIILRSLFDNALVIKVLSYESTGVSYFNSIYFSSNLIYIMIIMGSLLIYNIVLSKKEKTDNNMQNQTI
jgi:hypothetical protein